MGWLEGPLGQALMHDEQELVSELLGAFPPFREGLGVAPHSYAPVLDAITERSRWSSVLAPAAGSALAADPGAMPRPQSLVWGLPEALPFPSGRLDLVVLVHALEFSRSPYRILAETERVLAPNGRVLVLTFNPLSLFGLVHPWLRRLRSAGPWPGRFLTTPHVRRMLESTGLVPERSRYVFLRPPLVRERTLRACRFMERVPGRRRLPWGAVGCVEARKDEPGVTLLGPAFRAELAGSRKAGVPAYSCDNRS